jgi:hypothetical protein
MDLGLEEARDYDRVTLSGIHGPVHWKDERLPLVMDYDFPLSAAVSDAHVRSLRVRTATFLGLARRRYAAIVAYLRNSRYREVFGPTVLVFKGQVASDLKTAGRALHEVT